MRENFSSAYQSLSFDMWQVKTKLTPHFYIALLRMMIGLIFLTVAYSNWENGYYSEEGLQRFFHRSVSAIAKPVWVVRTIRQHHDTSPCESVFQNPRLL